ncbi:hypothetical protein E2C01_070385 [Portunus trituberculatus]|uniref:Uncharacterized protein n=1 Tax=Portunus trituberculatus TaxID=210409 RepID=A0A5B7I599_PORTR|nr:hypothetical protein [Portunus trituberculatus]
MEVVCTNIDNNLDQAPELPPIGQLRNSLARSLKLRLALSLEIHVITKMRKSNTRKSSYLYQPHLHCKMPS